ncbi:MAG: aminotransferase class IV [Anaerolineae bacterium]|uniref:aminotransferase class IV n=1 Tax=Promineifilum sp. TaxID=2664178 RepID=UPI001E0684D1|nr:aminotransferase class IV [Anaerolineales bacterium]MCO5181215.1 aminotransferase class IV [Promineifilum sp.]MCW5847979.1 aminotransferase class IV [Anaerolineae bacterium]
MSQFQLFAVEDAGPRPLPVPPTVTRFADLYHGLPLGVYDALRTFEHNKFLYLSRHLARTERSMALLGWHYTLDRARLLRALHGVVSAAEWPESRVRFDVLAAPDAATTIEGQQIASRELIAIQPFTPPPPELYARGVAVDFARGLTRESPLAKTADFAARRPAGAGLTQLEGTPADKPQPTDDVPYEYLLLDTDGRILEGTGTNFWAIRNGVVYTAGEGVLEGITREILLQIIPELGLPLRLEAVSVDEIAALDEAAVSGSSRALLPVVEIAGQAVGDGRPGPLTRRILAAYHAFVAANVKTAV